MTSANPLTDTDEQSCGVTADVPCLYRGAPADALRIQQLDSLTAIFDRRSGQTHIVAPPVPEILTAIAGAVASAADLASRLARDFDLRGEGADVIALLTERMDELAALGLVERL